MFHELSSLYQAHFQNFITHVSDALNVLNYDALVLGSGFPFTYFQGDKQALFYIDPQFAYLCPAQGPHHLICFMPGKRPVLIFYNPDDFWHNHAPLPTDTYWSLYFDIREAKTLEERWTILSSLGHMVAYSAFIGNESLIPQALGYKINCEFLNARINWVRRYKTPYEVYCLYQANVKAAPAHRAAYQMFLQGGSEYEIHLEYLRALQEFDEHLPYSGIVALDANSAILHHMEKRHKKNGRSFLIDSAASFSHYGADITRTYAGDACDTLFAELIAQVDTLQQDICALVKPGISYAWLHTQYHLLLGRLLHEVGILKCFDEQRVVHEGYVKDFFPHGLGHALGIHVHDIPKHQLDRQGNPVPFQCFDAHIYRSLRYIGNIEENMVLTIEPGLYFIPSLLAKRRSHPVWGPEVNWAVVDRLMPFGGIRIEDDLFVTAEGHRNLTREAFVTES